MVVHVCNPRYEGQKFKVNLSYIEFRVNLGYTKLFQKGNKRKLSLPGCMVYAYSLRVFAGCGRRLA